MLFDFILLSGLNNNKHLCSRDKNLTNMCLLKHEFNETNCTKCLLYAHIILYKVSSSNMNLNKKIGVFCCFTHVLGYSVRNRDY